MEKIGEGYFYNVLRINKTRVLKIQKTRIRIFWHIYRHHKHWSLLKLLKETRRIRKSMRSLGSLYEKLMEKIEDKDILGNPFFIDGIEYTQDYAKLFSNINNINNDKFRKIVMDYINLLNTLWSYGVSDEMFKFSHNCGYVKGKFVFLDFNEVTFKKEDVIKDIEKEIWLYMRSYKELSENKKEIYKTLMREYVTIENLNKYWIKS